MVLLSVLAQPARHESLCDPLRPADPLGRDLLRQDARSERREQPELLCICVGTRRKSLERGDVVRTISSFVAVEGVCRQAPPDHAHRSFPRLSPTMLTFRLTRTLIASLCLTIFMSGCCVTSVKLRKHQSCPCESQSGSGLMPIQQGIPAEYETLPPPAPLPPAPASASKSRNFGTQTASMFRSAGDKVKNSLDRWN